ncbi:23 kDa integral membrane protein [Drosophila grimshawi]|uniref:Tetraspanin n=1 Tax=Drosophila grimshawi TaxID=7222 RepID=B4J3X6_DROGR|nr:23 kDa integral membrane protein [Drosophila grimshawi]EDW01559.1 GH21507 [Drosophila grimshawi]
MGCATGTIKYTLFLFNALWAILGILVVVFGILGWGAMPQKYAVGIMVLGGIILVISMFGCFGAIRESARMLWTYVTLLLVLLVLIAVFIYFNSRDVFMKYAVQTVEDNWQMELTKPGSMDLIQKTYSCCGRYGPGDYMAIDHRNNTVPSSCCKGNNCLNPLNVYPEGCLTKVEAAFADEAITSRYCEWGLLGFDLIILSLAIILAIHYTNQRRRYNY